MQPSKGNRGDSVPQGIKSVDKDAIADMAAFDRLPARLRRLIANSAGRLYATDILHALENGFPVWRMEADLRAFDLKYCAALRAEREAS